MSNRLDLSAAIWAGLIAGLAFVVVEMLLVGTVGGQSPWGPPRMMSAIVMGKEVLPPPATFDLTVVMVGMIVHFALSAVLGIVAGLIISGMRLGMLAAIGVGLLFGLIVYFVNFYLFTAIFPWFGMARNWMTIFAHLVFGGVLGAVYHALAARRTNVHREAGR